MLYSAAMESASDYLHRRAREERAAADRAASFKAREVHLELAARYLRAATAGLPPIEAGPRTREKCSGLPMEFTILE